MAEIDVFKELPGYTAILRAVLKNQIQFLVNQLSEATGEESLILTASVSDGSFTHLGTQRGKTFLQKHDSIKTQFLGYCLTDNQPINPAEVSYENQYLSDNYRKTVNFSETSQSSSLESYPQQTNQSDSYPQQTNPNNLIEEKQARKKRRKSVPHKAHTNFSKEERTSQEIDPSEEDVKPVALFMSKEPEESMEMIGVGTSQGQGAGDQPVVVEDDQNGTNDSSLTYYKESAKFNDVTVASEMNFSGHEYDNQSDSDSQHLEYQTSDFIPNGEPGVNMVPIPSELDSLQSQVQALESEMTSHPLQSRFLSKASHFACSFCLKVFQKESDLRYHERTHQRSKIHSCDICQKEFSRKFNMVQHRQLHFEERQHGCKLCMKGFTRRDRLLMHYQSIHKTELGISGDDMVSLEKLILAVDGLP